VFLAPLQVDADVISAVLETHYHQVGRSIDSLLAMTADAAGEDSPPLHAADDTWTEGGAEAPAERAATSHVGAGDAATRDRAPAGGAAVAAAIEATAVAPVHRVAEAGGEGAREAPAHSGGPVAMLAPRGGAAAAHAAAAAAAAAADIRRASHASAGGRTPPGAPPSPARFSAAASGPETNLFAWVANLLSPNESAADGGAFAAWADGGARGGDGSAARGADGDDSDLWAWQRGSGAADAAEEEMALAAGTRLWDTIAVRYLPCARGFDSSVITNARLLRNQGLDTAAGYWSVLSGAPRSRVVLTMLDELAGKFNRHYDLFAGGPAVPVPRRLEAWRTELAAICAVVAAEFLELGGAFRSARWHAPHRDALQLAVESVVLATVHEKLMGGVQRLCERADEAMAEALARLARLPPSLLGVRREWADAAVDAEALRRFRQLPQLVMPYEKVLCVRDTLRKLVENVQALRQPRRRRRSGGGANFSGASAASGEGGFDDDANAAATEAQQQQERARSSMPMPCADDVLSLMVVLLARARVKHLVAAAVYMDTFLCMTEATSHKGELGYALANFMAACEYVRSKDVARLCAEWEENGRAWEAQMGADADDNGAHGGAGGDNAAGAELPRDPLGVHAGAAELAAAPARRASGQGASAPVAPLSPGQAARQPSLDGPWLAPAAPPPPPPGPQHAGVVRETARGAAHTDPLGALYPGGAGDAQAAMAELSLDGEAQA